MRVVRDTDGDLFRLVESSSGAAVVEDPASGERRRLPIEDLERVTAATLSDAVGPDAPEPVRRLRSAVRDDLSLSLLLVVAERGPTAVETIVDWTDACESDLHGRFAELRCAGLLSETTVHGRPGYEATDDAIAALDRLLD